MSGRRASKALAIVLIALSAGCGRDPSDGRQASRAWQVIAGPEDVQLHFEHPLAIATDPHGNLLVADSQARVVQKIAPGGRLLATWRSGRDRHPFRGLTGIAAAPDGSLYVAEAGGNRVERLSPSGGVLAVIGGRGSGPGQLRAPQGVAVDRDGHVYVTDAGNSRIEVFSPSGAYEASWSVRSGRKGHDDLQGLAVDRRGFVYVADEFWMEGWVGGCAPGPARFSSLRILKLTPRGAIAARWVQDGSTTLNILDISGVAVDAHDRVLVADDQANVVRLLSGRGHPIWEWRNSGSSLETSTSLSGVATGAGGIYVADAGNGRVHQLSAAGETRAVWGAPADLVGAVSGVSSLAVGADGRVYAGGLHGQIRVFSSRGGLVGRWTIPHGAPADTASVSLALDRHGTLFAAPGGYDHSVVFKLSRDDERLGSYGTSALTAPILAMALDSSGNLFVLQAFFGPTGASYLVKLSPSGEDLAEFGYEGSGHGGLRDPGALALDSTGNVYVADTDNDRIVKYSSSGTWLAQWGTHGTKSGEFNAPGDVQVDAAGHIFVADTGNDRIQELSATGTPIATWGGEGGAPGRFSRPVSLALDADGDLFVADSGNDRIQVLAPKGYVTVHAAQEGGRSLTRQSSGDAGALGARHPGGTAAPSASRAAPSGCGAPPGTYAGGPEAGT